MAAKITTDTVLAGRYRVLRRLGQGGMGEVFAAENTRTRRVVAVKVLRAERRTEASVERFRREARASGTVQSDHVTEVIDVEDDPTHGLVIVFELLEGESLVDRLNREGPIPWAELHPLMEQMWTGLTDAHRAGVVHRDLKPSNIFLERRPDGSTRVKLLDFGISKLPRELGGDSLTKTGQSLGTFSFMPPEQVEMSKQVDHRADIYSCGTVVFQALTGKLPFAASNLVLLLELKTRARAARLSDVSTVAVDPRLDAFVAKALERRMEDRFSTATEALEAWRALRPAPSVPSLPAASPSPSAAATRGQQQGTAKMQIPFVAPPPLAERAPRLHALVEASVALRSLTPEVLFELLGREATPPVVDFDEARTLWWQLSRENQLFAPSTDGLSLLLRPEVKGVMLERATRERPHELRSTHARAAYWYDRRPGAADRADVVYHFLCLGLFDEAEDRFTLAIGAELTSWRDDLPMPARAWLDEQTKLRSAGPQAEDERTTNRLGLDALPPVGRTVMGRPQTAAMNLARDAPAVPAPVVPAPAVPAPAVPAPAAPAPAVAAPAPTPGAPGQRPPAKGTDPDPQAPVLQGTVRSETAAFLVGAAEAQRSVVSLWIPIVEMGRLSQDAGGSASGMRGSGFYLAPDLLLTALYVVRARRPGDTLPDEADFAEQVRGATLDGERRGRALLAHSEALGYALLEVARDPRAVPVRVGQEPFAGGRASVVHYASGVKTVVFTQASAPSRSRIEYLADSSRGWYGAPLFDREWAAVGVDWGARVREGVSLRLATPLTDVLADLATHYPEVRARLEGGR